LFGFVGIEIGVTMYILAYADNFTLFEDNELYLVFVLFFCLKI